MWTKDDRRVPYGLLPDASRMIRRLRDDLAPNHRQPPTDVPIPVHYSGSVQRGSLPRSLHITR